MTTIHRRAALVLAVLAGATTTAAFASPVAFADPVPSPECVRPDGSPCPPPAPGCVQENGLPCSASLPDLNAACVRNPVVCLFAI